MKNIWVIRHVADEALGKLESVFTAAGATIDLIDVFADDWQARQVQGFDAKHVGGLVVMGGPLNVDQVEQYPFLTTEIAWLRQAVTAGVPTLGICLGAQLLAHALGAEVYRHRLTEIGWYGLELLPTSLDDPLFAGAATTQTVFQWHGQTFDLPQGSVLLGKGATCRHQAFRYGSRAWGIQFHPEITEVMVGEWLDHPPMAKEVARHPEINATEIRQRAGQEIEYSAPLVEQIFSRFVELCGAR